jgi:hypothetical protein
MKNHFSEEQDIPKILQAEWQKVRKKFHYPRLNSPKLIKEEATGGFSLENLELTISEPFIKKFEEYEIPLKEIINEILMHETIHFMKYPGSKENLLMLQKSSQGITDDDKIVKLSKVFIESQTDIYMLNVVRNPTTATMMRLYGVPENSLGKLIYALCQEVSGQDLGVRISGREMEKSAEIIRYNPEIDFSGPKLDERIREIINPKESEEGRLLDELKKIDYLNKKKEVGNFRKFVEILKDYNSPQDKSGGENNDGGKNKKKSSGTDKGKNSEKDNPGNPSPEQNSGGCSSPNEYEKIFSRDGEDKQKKTQLIKKRGKNPGLKSRETFLAGDFYTGLSESYDLLIKKKRTLKGGLYPSGHVTFGIGDSLEDVDGFSTPGILPGQTKKWVKEGGEKQTEEESFRDCLLMKDTSPSMFSEIQNSQCESISPDDKQYPHIVGATAISNAYLSSKKKVALYTFGNEDHLVFPTRDKEFIHRELRRYSLDGQTIFNSELVQDFIKKYKKELDVYIISDMNVERLDEFILTILGIPQTHKVHLLHTATNEFVNKIKQNFAERENIQISPLINYEDLEQLVL